MSTDGEEMLVELEKEPHYLVPQCCRVRGSQGKLSGYLLGAQVGRGRYAPPVEGRAQEKGRFGGNLKNSV